MWFRGRRGPRSKANSKPIQASRSGNQDAKDKAHDSRRRVPARILRPLSGGLRAPSHVQTGAAQSQLIFAQMNS